MKDVEKKSIGDNVAKPAGKPVKKPAPAPVPTPAPVEVAPPEVKAVVRNVILDKLSKIQADLNVPKSEYNSFGKYAYRTAEGILEALKPILQKHDCTITLDDEVIVPNGSDRVYVRSTVSLHDVTTGNYVSTSAYAREALAQKGMNESQITGSCSSYARKYALNGLLAINDVKDADSQDNTKPQELLLTDSLKKEIDDITDVEKLREFYKKNSGKGKEVDAYIMKKSKELSV